MDDFLQSLIRGLGTGSIYSLLALGFVIIYKSTQVISFAHSAQRALTAVVSRLRRSWPGRFKLSVERSRRST